MLSSICMICVESPVASADEPEVGERVGWFQKAGEILRRVVAEKRDVLEVREEEIMIPMRDGTRLAADVYRPILPGAYPAVLIRTPYGKSDLSLFGYVLAGAGFVAVCQDSRGRFDSEGECRAFLDDGWGFHPTAPQSPEEEHWDGYDTVEWTAEQSWCNERVGMFGVSAQGIAVLAAAGAKPPHLTCAVVYVAASDLYQDAAHQGGGFRKALVEGWLESVNAEPDVLDLLIEHEAYDSLWRKLSVVERATEIEIPIYHSGGWFDIFLQGTLNGFTDLQSGGAAGAFGNQKVVIGPWTHGGQYGQEQGELVYPLNSVIIDDELENALDWFAYWMKSDNNDIVELRPVRYYLMGDVDDPAAPGNEWREADIWPVPSREESLYLHSDGSLSGKAPSSDALRTFSSDPDDPVPTIGGANLNLPAGPYDQRHLESRSDVLVYTSETLTEPLEVTGRLLMTLHASSSAVDADWVVKICDVYPDGRSMLAAEGMLRARYRQGFQTAIPVVPGEIEELEIDLWSTAMVFNTGHRIRVHVTGSNAPRFDPNPNTGEPLRRNTGTIVAENVVYTGPARLSRIAFPVTAPAKHPLFEQVPAAADFIQIY